jgi:hypothetical protein
MTKKEFEKLKLKELTELKNIISSHGINGFARLKNCDASYISRIMNNKTKISLEKIVELINEVF